VGSFFTNIQVRTGAEGREAIVRALKTALGAGRTDVDRTVVVRGVDAGGWVAIYDSHTESQDGRALDALATLASSAAKAPAFSVLVHDSDVLLLGLFESGSLEDRFDSWPDYFEPCTAARKKEVAGDVSKWARLLPPGASEEELRVILTRDDMRAERTLHDLATLLGVEVSRARVGFRYLEEADRDDPGTIVIRARARERPVWEGDAGGPPVFVAPPDLAVPTASAVGDTLRVSVSTLNQGGPSRGLRFAAWGSAITDGLVAVSAVELLLGGGLPAGLARHELARANSGGGDEMWVVRLPSQVIPAGPAPSEMPVGGDGQGWQAAQSRGRVHVNVIGEALQVGSGELHVGVTSLEHPEVQATMSYRVRVQAPLWKPLRSAPAMPMVPQSMLLKPLSGAYARVALAVLGPGASREVQGAEAVRLLEELVELTHFEGPLHQQVFLPEPGKKPRSKTHQRWPKSGVDAHLGVSSVFCIEGRPPPPPTQPDIAEMLERMASGGGGSRTELGLIVGAKMFAPPEREQALVIGVWLRSDAAEAAGKRVGAWLAALSESGVLLQATWSLAGWIPSFDLSSTEYERACGIHGMGTDLAWCKRYLRWPGRGRIFLSAEHLSRLDSSVLSRVAELEDGAHGSWLQKRPSVTRTDWEGALADVLPGLCDVPDF